MSSNCQLISDFPTDASLDFETAVQQINQKLQPFNKQIIIKKHEQFNEEYVVFSNTIPPLPVLQSKQKFMQPNDYKYLEAVLKAILTSEEYKIRYNVALTTEANEDGVKKRRSLATDNESLLQNWIRMGYLSHRDDGYIFLGPKSIAEFGGYIQSTFPDLDTCPLCLAITFMVSF